MCLQKGRVRRVRRVVHPDELRVQQSTKVAIDEILCQMIADPTSPWRAPDLPIHVAILR